MTTESPTSAFLLDNPLGLTLPLTANESAEAPTASASASPVQATLRVMHVINGEHFSGAERVQDHLANELPQLAVAVEFACVKPDRFPQMRTSTVPLHDVGMRHKFDFGAVRTLMRLARERDVQILHAHTPRSAMIAARAARKLKLPFVFHVHSPTSRDSTRWITNWCNHAIEWWSIRQATRIVTVSDTLREHTIRSGINGAKVTVVANGVPRRAPVKRPPLSRETITLGTIALFRPRKGTEVLLDALAQLKSAGHNVRLRAIGGFETEEYGRSLLDRTRTLGLESCVEWTGFTRDIDAALETLDLFVLPSLFGEGMPMVVLEAMAAGVPVVATSVEGVPQVITDQQHGRLAEPASATSLASVIAELLNDRDQTRRLGEQGRERQRECFSDRSMAEGVAKVYRSILSGV